MGAVGGLIFDCRVPPRVVVDDGVGGGEVEADATGFEADQEDWDFAFLEAPDRGFTVDGVAGQGDIRQAEAVEFLLDQLQHAGELREKQDAAIFVDQFRQHRHQQIELGSFFDFGGGSGLDEARVATDLT